MNEYDLFLADLQDSSLSPDQIEAIWQKHELRSEHEEYSEYEEYEDD